MSFSTFDLSSDVASNVTSINEVVSISSSIYAPQTNIKYFQNIASSSQDLGGYWETVYDSSPTSSLATALLDITYGYATGSAFNVAPTVSSSQNEKIKIYREMASLLLGDPDALFSINGNAAKECFFVLIKRGIQKDEIKKGATSIILNGVTQLTASDAGASTNFKQTVGGDYAPLFSGSSTTEVGQVWYNSGIIVLKAGVAGTGRGWPAATTWSGTKELSEVQYSGTINQIVDGFRNHTDNLNFHNQTNLYSTIYFCRARNAEFNYSSNPTFVDDNQRIVVTSGSNILQTRTYITTIGLYDANDNLLAVAKTNKPIAKSPDSEATFRIRLDY